MRFTSIACMTTPHATMAGLGALKLKSILHPGRPLGADSIVTYRTPGPGRPANHHHVMPGRFRQPRNAWAGQAGIIVRTPRRSIAPCGQQQTNSFNCQVARHVRPCIIAVRRHEYVYVITVRPPPHACPRRGMHAYIP